jgi:hypothetical protein
MANSSLRLGGQAPVLHHRGVADGGEIFFGGFDAGVESCEKFFCVGWPRWIEICVGDVEIVSLG